MRYWLNVYRAGFVYITLGFYTAWVGCRPVASDSINLKRILLTSHVFLINSSDVYIGAMKMILSKPSLTGLAIIAAITLALMSVCIERTGPELVQYGNLCGPAALDPCYKPALKGGFPVAYLFDAPGVSRERQLAFGEDKVHVGALIAYPNHDCMTSRMMANRSNRR